MDHRPPPPSGTWPSLVRWATSVLADAGVASPQADATWLACHRAGGTPAALVTAPPPAGAARDGFAADVARRTTREPLQHIIGTAPFRTVTLAVGPGVFVPRPETELVAGWAVDAAQAAGPAPVVADLCTGSGAIALAVAHEVPDAVVHAVEADAEAAAWAQRNLAGSGVHLHREAARDCLSGLDGGVDVVVANPPYIPRDAVIRDPEVARWDPPAALWGGVDGLDVVRDVVAAARRLLRTGGTVVIEHADLQGDAVPRLLLGAEWSDVADHSDLAGRPRFTTARRA